MMKRFLNNALPVGGASMGGIYESITKINFMLDINNILNNIINVAIAAIIGGTIGYFLKLLYDSMCWRIKQQIEEKIHPDE